MQTLWSRMIKELLKVQLSIVNTFLKLSEHWKKNKPPKNFQWDTRSTFKCLKTFDFTSTFHSYFCSTSHVNFITKKHLFFDLDIIQNSLWFMRKSLQLLDHKVENCYKIKSFYVDNSNDCSILIISASKKLI